LRRLSFTMMLRGSSQLGGSGFSRRRLVSVKTPRVDSSLRGPRRPRSHCRAVLSGPNKTMFASIGPNSHGRDHRRRGRFMGVGPGHAPSRIKATRGHRIDGISRPASLPAVWDITSIPPYVYGKPGPGSFVAEGIFLRGLIGLGRPLLFDPSPVGPGLMVCGFADGVGLLVPVHGKEDLEQPSGHGDIGLGLLSGGSDQPVSDLFLCPVGSAQDHGRLAQDPAKGSRELMPVTSELPQASGLGIGNPAERALAPGQPFADVLGVVKIVLPPLAPAVGQFGGVGDADKIHDRAVAVEEPLDKAVDLHRHPDRAGQRSKKLLDLVHALGAGRQVANHVLTRIDGDQSDRVLVQIDPDEGDELFERPESAVRRNIGN